MKINKKKIFCFMMLVMFLSLTIIASGANFTCTSPTPANSATGVSRHPALPVSATVHTANGSKMTVFCWSNDTGSYHKSNTLTNVGNTTVNWNLNAMTYGHKYYWGINISNATNHVYLNTTFTFTTEAEPSALAQSNYLIDNVLPILIAVAILMVLVGVIFTIGLTKEGLITIMIITIIGIIVIQVITGL